MPERSSTLALADFLTTRQAAAELGVSAPRVRQLVLEGRLRATKHGRDLVIRRADLEAVRVRVAGWPKGRLRGPRRPRP